MLIAYPQNPLKMSIDWIKSPQTDKWYKFSELNLEHSQFHNLTGIYVLRSGAYVVKLGYGNLRTRLKQDKKDLKIMAFPNLEVTWGEVKQDYQKGIERFLDEFYKPFIGTRFYDDEPIIVNLP
jgi:hypothetical protein